MPICLNIRYYIQLKLSIVLKIVDASIEVVNLVYNFVSQYWTPGMRLTFASGTYLFGAMHCPALSAHLHFWKLSWSSIRSFFSGNNPQGCPSPFLGRLMQRQHLALLAIAIGFNNAFNTRQMFPAKSMLYVADSRKLCVQMQ